MTIVKAKPIRAKKSQFEKVLKNLILKLKLFVCWLVGTFSSKTTKFANRKISVQLISKNDEMKFLNPNLYSI